MLLLSSYSEIFMRCVAVSCDSLLVYIFLSIISLILVLISKTVIITEQLESFYPGADV